MTGSRAIRVLIVDDEPSLIQDYKYLLSARPEAGDPDLLSDKLERDLFGAAVGRGKFPAVDLTACQQGRDAVEAVRAALDEGLPFTLAFIDMYLAPDLDGIQTAEQIRALDPDIYIVLVSTRSDMDPLEMSERVPPTDQLFFVKKPFHGLEIQQLTMALGAKWRAEHRAFGLGKSGMGTGAGGWLETLERIPAGIVVFDRRDRLLLVNEALARLFPELVDLFVPGTRYEDIQHEIAERLLPENALVRVDAWVKDRLAWHAKSGGVTELRLRGSRWVLLIEDTAPLGETYCMYYDISALKRRETNRAMAAHMTQMAQSFAALCERLPALFREAGQGEEPESANRRGGADVAVLPGVSGHDSGEPVQVLTGQLQAIAQRQRLSPESIGLNRVAGEVVRRLRNELPDGVEAEVIAGAGLWPVLIDRKKFSNALTELIHNAYEAMNGGGRLTVETANIRLSRDFVAARSGLSPGEYVRVSVQDTGQGMSPELAERALNPFFTSKDKNTHLGLGLSIAYGFANQSGGYIEIDGGQGRGATVDLYFPRAEEVSTTPVEEEVAKRLASGGGNRPAAKNRA